MADQLLRHYRTHDHNHVVWIAHRISPKSHRYSLNVLSSCGLRCRSCPRSNVSKPRRPPYFLFEHGRKIRYLLATARSQGSTLHNASRSVGIICKNNVFKLCKLSRSRLTPLSLSHRDIYDSGPASYSAIPELASSQWAHLTALTRWPSALLLLLIWIVWWRW